MGRWYEALKCLCTYFSKNDGLRLFSAISFEVILISTGTLVLIGAKTGTSDNMHAQIAMAAPEK